jgi:hypothetical protein
VRHVNAPRAYDLLGSASAFDKVEFANVWNDIFEFCSVPEKTADVRAAAVS